MHSFDADRPGDLIMMVTRAMRRGFIDSLEPIGISPHQARALRAITQGAEQDELRLSDIADRLRIAPRSATEVVDALEEKGLVERCPSPSDRRAVCVNVTAAGSDLIDQIESTRADRADQILGPLDDNERTELVRLLRKALGSEER
ncbi:MAG: MarR family transcriptional regulator [Antricoccus sp.]